MRQSYHIEDHDLQGADGVGGCGGEFCVGLGVAATSWVIGAGDIVRPTRNARLFTSPGVALASIQLAMVYY